MLGGEEGEEGKLFNNKLKLKMEPLSNIPVFGYEINSPSFFDHSQKNNLILLCYELHRSVLELFSEFAKAC